jgi:hypothetical protein
MLKKFIFKGSGSAFAGGKAARAWSWLHI